MTEYERLNNLMQVAKVNKEKFGNEMPLKIFWSNVYDGIKEVIETSLVSDLEKEVE